MNTSIEERKVMAELALKKALYSFPFVGPFLEVMFEYRGKVKRERLLKFVELLDEEFSKNNVYIEKLKTEESSDLFETILKKATETRSDAKRVYFKNILLFGLRDNKQIDYCEIFSELLLNLRDVQIEILAKHSDYLIDGKGVLNVRNAAESELATLENKNTMGHDDYDPWPHETYVRVAKEFRHKAYQADIKLKDYKEHCIAKAFSLTEGEYNYFVQDLASKGLLYDDGVGAIGTRALEIVSITELGLKFLSFLHGEEKQAD